MSKLIRTAVLAGAVSLMAAASANATTGPAMYMTDGTPGLASNTAAISGNTVSFPGHTFSVGGAQVHCGDAAFTITHVTTNGATIDPTYTGCALTVSGTPVAAATVDVPCDWDISGGIFDNTTGGVTGASVTTTCVTTITAEAVGCTIHVAAQTRTGITANNITEAAANTTAATPWGAKIVASVTGLTYTTTGTCPGITEHGTGTYAGTVAVRNVTAGL